MEDAKETQKSWENEIPHWSIVGLNGGTVKGAGTVEAEGHGDQIEEVSDSDLQDGCEKYGEFIMCLPCPTKSKF